MNSMGPSSTAPSRTIYSTHPSARQSQPRATRHLPRTHPITRGDAILPPPPRQIHVRLCSHPLFSTRSFNPFRVVTPASNHVPPNTQALENGVTTRLQSLHGVSSVSPCARGSSQFGKSQCSKRVQMAYPATLPVTLAMPPSACTPLLPMPIKLFLHPPSHYLTPPLFHTPSASASSPEYVVAIISPRPHIRIPHLTTQTKQPRSSLASQSSFLSTPSQTHTYSSLTTMAFVPAVPASLTSSKKLRQISSRPSNLPSRILPRATSATPSSTPTPSFKSKPHKKTPGHVVDSRVAGRVESHHWIVVRDHSMRIFERAAVAQADVTRQVEKRAGKGALHRWVLRQVADPTHSAVDVQFRHRDGRYVVMESFDRHNMKMHEQPMMRRWLSAVERVGPLMNTVDISTRYYQNVFTSKLHDVTFDPHNNIVVVESINVDMSNENGLHHVVGVLRQGAEASVSTGECLEFCVLWAPGEAGFFKTIEVYKDVDALTTHMNGVDQSMAKKMSGYTIEGKRSRQTFKPVVFA